MVVDPEVAGSSPVCPVLWDSSSMAERSIYVSPKPCRLLILMRSREVVISSVSLAENGLVRIRPPRSQRMPAGTTFMTLMLHSFSRIF